MRESPFIPGARVAVGERFGDEVTEGFVDKVYKNGNFTLRGSKQQWKGWKNSFSDGRWSALETTTGYGRRRLDLWDDETDKEIREKIAKRRSRLRMRQIMQKLEAIKDPTPTLCDALEASLSLMPREQKERA